MSGLRPASCIVATAAISAALWTRAPQAAGTATTRIEMHDVQYHYDSSLFVHIRHLRGVLERTRKDVPPTFDDSRSFHVRLDSAEIGIHATELTTLLNKYVFDRSRSPIKDLRVTMEDGKLKQKGTVHKGIDLPFEMRAEVSATPDGMIRLHPVQFKVLHVPVKGALHLVGLHIQDLVNPKGAPGVRIVKDDLILDPSQMLPAPRMRGRITAVRIEGENLVQSMGAAPAAKTDARNCIRFRGGIIRFGKLTMHDADLSLIDAQPRDPFEFSLARYKDQLVAGYSKTTPSFGLEVFMPDVTQLDRRTISRTDGR